jgi:hypothetical protein
MKTDGRRDSDYFEWAFASLVIIVALVFICHLCVFMKASADNQNDTPQSKPIASRKLSRSKTWKLDRKGI